MVSCRRAAQRGGAYSGLLGLLAAYSPLLSTLPLIVAACWRNVS